MGQTRNKNKKIREMENNISIPQCRNRFTNVLRFFSINMIFQSKHPALKLKLT